MIRANNNKLKFICKSGNYELYQGITSGSTIKSETEATEISGGHIPAFFVKKNKRFVNLQRYVNRQSRLSEKIRKDIARLQDKKE